MSAKSTDMFTFDVSPLALVLRTTVVYLVLISAVRLLGRREMGSMGLPDLLMIVLIADGVQNAMAAEYSSVSGGLIVAGTLLFWNWALDWLSYHVPAARRLINPQPLTLVENGRIVKHNLRRELISTDELEAQLRVQGIEDIRDVRRVQIEPDGEVSVQKRRESRNEQEQLHPTSRQSPVH